MPIPKCLTCCFSKQHSSANHEHQTKEVEGVSAFNNRRIASSIAHPPTMVTSQPAGKKVHNRSASVPTSDDGPLIEISQRAVLKRTECSNTHPLANVNDLSSRERSISTESLLKAFPPPPAPDDKNESSHHINHASSDFLRHAAFSPKPAVKGEQTAVEGELIELKLINHHEPVPPKKQNHGQIGEELKISVSWHKASGSTVFLPGIGQSNTEDPNESDSDSLILFKQNTV